MPNFRVTYTVSNVTSSVVAPMGLNTPHAMSEGVEVIGGKGHEIFEGHTQQPALLIEPSNGSMQLVYSFKENGGEAYADSMFQPKASRFTVAAEALVEETQAIEPDADPLTRATAIACATAQRFTYGHPKDKFTDGQEQVPALGCGIAEGSCVDINTYFMAALRSVGIEAGYLTGFFFPAEKGNYCTDGHCWVTTRHQGKTYEWDIAHHIKMGTRDIKPGLNPKPGFRAAAYHSMGLDFPEIGVKDHKALIEPGQLVDGKIKSFNAPDIRLHHPDIAN